MTKDFGHCSEWRLATCLIGRRTLVFRRLDSTNTVAADLATNPADDGLAVLAYEQTAGRGQRGRSWLCPAGAGVLLSVAIFPPASVARTAVLTAWAAIAVCEAVQQLTGVAPTIKWPNDVHVGGKKIAGVLIERGNVTIAGIGLNLSQSADDLASLGLHEATSVAAVLGRSPRNGDRTFEFRGPVPVFCEQGWESTARLLLTKLDALYAGLLQGELGALEASWNRLLGLHGKTVSVLSITNQEFIGRCTCCTFEGMTLEDQLGHLTTLSPESIRHVREPS